MFIIAESGTTKSDWVVVNSKSDLKFFKTNGINPATESKLLNLEVHAELLDAIQAATDIYYYGAGIVNKESKVKIRNWLSEAGYAGTISVEDDLLAAARACSGDFPAIVCILGTGSNSGVYDGRSITKKIPGLGYIFSDEGGGTHLGKEIIKSYFYDTMPDDVKEHFRQNFPTDKEIILKNVYRSPGAGKFIASFAPLLTKVEGVWKENLLKNVFREFVTLRILNYQECTKLPIYFVGSMAYLHQTNLKEVLFEYGLQATKILQHPIQDLITYHLKKQKYE